MTALIGIGSLAVDLGHVQLTKTEMYRAADAASRAAMAQVQSGVTQAQNTAVSYASYNTVDGTPLVLNPNTDIEFGTWDPNAGSFTLLSGSARSNANAVRVTARRTAANGNAVSLCLGAVIGRPNFDLTVQVIASASTSGYGIVGLSSVTTSPNHLALQFDSWNSNNGNYSGYPQNSNANIASNGNITLDSSSAVRGNCRPGIGKSITNPSCVSGSTANLTSALNFPAPTPGTAATVNNNSSLPAAYFNSSTRDFNIPNGQAMTLPGGTYYVNNINWDTANITFTGPAVFYITGSTFSTTNNYITTYNNLPANLKFEVTGAATVTYDFDQSCYAVVYAPLANVTTTGYAADFGSIVANNLTMLTAWHVDEALGGAGVTGGVDTVK